ncbi:PREDICTED: probable trehalose-phosphate phosphatase 1 isoform X2 [Ipomoea nil]|uniref:probable trehalose-phosphate phosphatase 1 isoform X2 n=1 Tax=Ipomoea nil TaxID=35883 RepID=UPI0009013520|nr:PREDICTED: probable trehalose-phosphate phosphatase 1 isoform X2 [Ipomoea nil]
MAVGEFFVHAHRSNAIRKMRDNIPRFYKLVGLPKWLAKAHNIEAFAKVKYDKYHPSEYSEEEPIHPLSIEPIIGDPKCNSWLQKHPSALSSFNGIMSAAKGKQIVVFLDYDGTLSPIVSDPDKAFMSAPMRSAVHDVARHFPTAIISGRGRDKVFGFVELDEVYYAGSHGMDIMGPATQVKSYDAKYQTRTVDKKGNEISVFQPAHDFLPLIEKMLGELREATCDVKGAFIEDNRFCISVHYRQVLEKDYALLEKKVHAILSNYPKFHVTIGKKVLEIRPSIKWNKGHALLYLLEALGFSDSSSNVFPFYIGDDKTDEDAFKVLKSRAQGCPIIVSSVAKETMASYSLRDPLEVLSFLNRLARWGKINAITSP